MPTARELLEQADALMRRQREPDMRGAQTPEPAEPHGPATDSTFAPTGQPREAPRSPFADPRDAPARMPSSPGTLASLHWSAPPAPSGVASVSPAFAAPPSISPRTIQREPIAPSVARTALPVHHDEPAPAGERDDDFPVLTEAVRDDEIAALDVADVPLLTEAVGDEPILEDLDEPSVWDPVAGGPPSVSGRGPDSTAVVPPVATASPAVLAEGPRDPLGLDSPAPGFATPQALQWQPPAPVYEQRAPAESPADEVPLPADAEAPLAEAPQAAEVEAPAAVDAEAPPPQVDVVEDELAPVGASDAPAGEPRVLAPLDDARVRAIAEEIGMQVLQRIDIFTDTELRTRLGERLQPVVERVSAELVGAINQHVGELLRAYVAEAIEREIDRWRQSGG